MTAPFAGEYTAVTQEQTPGVGNIYARVEKRKKGRYACGKRGNPTEMTCAVVDVSHFDYTYAPELNVETTETDRCDN